MVNWVKEFTLYHYTTLKRNMSQIVNDAVGARAVEWDGEHDVFDIRDPYFLFYLRWSETADS